MSANNFGFGTQIRKSPYFDATVRWGAKGFSVYDLSKFLNVVAKVYARRQKSLSEDEQDILSKVFDLTKKYRNHI